MNNQTLLYLYFDSLERSLKSRYDDLINRLLRSKNPVSYSELAELMSLNAKLEIIRKIELDLNSMLFYN